MNVINIEIKNKIAKTTSDVQYVCGNSDYLIRFSFDEEWDQYETKTARIVNGDGEYHDVVFTGCECDMPIISNAYAIKIGVFAGNLHTTTPAYVPAVKSILCGAGTPADPPEDVYAQIMEMLNAGGGEVTDEQIAQAVSKYLEENPIAGVTPEEVLVAVDAALEAAKDSGEFDGEDGKTPVRGVDYWTEADREQIVGEVLGEIDEGVYVLIDEITLNGETALVLTQEPNGTPYNFSNIIVEIETSNKSDVVGHVYPNILIGEVAGAAYGLANGIAVGSKRYMATGVNITKGIAESFATSVGQDSSSATTLYRRPYTAFASGYVDKVRITASVPFPEGTLVRIKAVRV